MQISEKRFNKLELAKMLDPDFVVRGRHYYLLTKNVEEDTSIYRAEKVKVSAGEIEQEKGLWKAVYFCIEDDAVIYLGKENRYGDSWFLVEEVTYNELD